MTPSDKEDMLRKLRHELQRITATIAEIEATPTRTPCESCAHFENDVCIAFCSPVPLEYRNQTSCPQFEDDIPF